MFHRHRCPAFAVPMNVSLIMVFFEDDEIDEYLLEGLKEMGNCNGKFWWGANPSQNIKGKSGSPEFTDPQYIAMLVLFLLSA